jgi:hypothetical protein
LLLGFVGLLPACPVNGRYLLKGQVKVNCLPWALFQVLLLQLLILYFCVGKATDNANCD